MASAPEAARSGPTAVGRGRGCDPTSANRRARRCDTPGMSLVSVAELAAALDNPDLRIADVRWSLAAPGGGRVSYNEAHIPGAVFVDLESVLTATQGPGRHPLPDPD